MCSYWMTGENIVEIYGILDFELNDLIKNGLDAYEPTTGYKYVDNLAHKILEKPSTLAANENQNSAIRIQLNPRKKKRMFINQLIDIRDFNGLDEEVYTNIHPANCRAVSFVVPDDHEKAAEFFARNRSAIFRSSDVERIMAQFDVMPVQERSSTSSVIVFPQNGSTSTDVSISRTGNNFSQNFLEQKNLSSSMDENDIKTSGRRRKFSKKMSGTDIAKYIISFNNLGHEHPI